MSNVVDISFLRVKLDQQAMYDIGYCRAGLLERMPIIERTLQPANEVVANGDAGDDDGLAEAVTKSNASSKQQPEVGILSDVWKVMTCDCPHYFLINTKTFNQWKYASLLCNLYKKIN